MVCLEITGEAEQLASRCHASLSGLPYLTYAEPVPAKPKKKCCTDKPRCKRCPIRMLAEGTLPEGFTVKKRKLVKTDKVGKADKGKKLGKRLPEAA